jgi:hypothetical protein
VRCPLSGAGVHKLLRFHFGGSIGGGVCVRLNGDRD